MKARHTLSLVLLCVLALVMATAASCGGGPVAADEAQIEMTYTGEGTSYVGDREIIQGTATVTISNESTGPLTVGAFRYENGADGLAEALAVVEEGSNSGPADPTPPGAFTAELVQTFEPGSYTREMNLKPGTYIFDSTTEGPTTTGLWRLAVIEVVAE